MLGRRRWSPPWAYLAMAAFAGSVVVTFTLISEPAPRAEPTTDRTLPLEPAPSVPSLERDFLTAVLDRPRPSDTSCPWRVVFGTTAPIEDVIASLEAEGYVARPGDRDVVRPGPFPQVRWTAEMGSADRVRATRVEVARGADVGRPGWPTVFEERSTTCRTRPLSEPRSPPPASP